MMHPKQTRAGDEPCPRPLSAFTLIELLVVLTTIAVLMGILLTCLGAARERAKRTVCAANLQQIGRGLIAYGSDYHALPPSSFHQFSRNYSGKQPYLVYAKSVLDPRDDEPGRRWAVYNLGYLHLNGFIPNPKIFYCPSIPKGRDNYDRHAAVYHYPFDYSYTGPRVGCCTMTISYGYIPQSGGREKLSNDRYAYQAAYRPSTLNTRAPLAFDTIYYYEPRQSYHRTSSQRIAGFNLLVGDGSVRFRAFMDAERELWDASKETEKERDALRALLYMFSE